MESMTEKEVFFCEYTAEVLLSGAAPLRGFSGLASDLLLHVLGCREGNPLVDSWDRQDWA
jgi:hypothetical protein